MSVLMSVERAMEICATFENQIDSAAIAHKAIHETSSDMQALVSAAKCMNRANLLFGNLDSAIDKVFEAEEAEEGVQEAYSVLSECVVMVQQFQSLPTFTQLLELGGYEDTTESLENSQNNSDILPICESVSDEIQQTLQISQNASLDLRLTTLFPNANAPLGVNATICSMVVNNKTLYFAGEKEGELIRFIKVDKLSGLLNVTKFYAKNVIETPRVDKNGKPTEPKITPSYVAAGVTLLAYSEVTQEILDNLVTDKILIMVTSTEAGKQVRKSLNASNYIGVTGYAITKDMASAWCLPIATNNIERSRAKLGDSYEYIECTPTSQFDTSIYINDVQYSKLECPAGEAKEAYAGVYMNESGDAVLYDYYYSPRVAKEKSTNAKRPQAAKKAEKIVKNPMQILTENRLIKQGVTREYINLCDAGDAVLSLQAYTEWCNSVASVEPVKELVTA